MELLYYFLKVSACTVLFFAFYLLALRRLTFFKINRFYLLITLLVSFIIPTLQLTVEREVAQTEILNFPTVLPGTEIPGTAYQTPIVVGTEPALQEAFNYYSLLPYLYLSIVAGLLIFASWRLFQLIRHTRKGSEKINGLKIVSKTSGFTNCSFFNYVFIDEGSLTQEELGILLKHEEVHAKQLHSIDKIIMMIVKSVLWFNPVVYLYDKALEQAHEYEADEATSQSFGTTEYASLLLRLAVSKSEMVLVHNFVKSPIKQRIKMLFNSKSKAMKKLMYLLALPIGLGLLWGFTVDVVEVFPLQKNEEKVFTLVLDAGHGGKDKGPEVNGYAEKDLTLTMANKIKTIAEAKGIKVITTRDADTKISLKDRAKAEGTILISLHINAEPLSNGGKRNGLEMITSGSYNNDLKLPKSNSITYYLYKELKNITGIKVNNKPKLSQIFLLNQSPMPGIVLEMGYLTNKSDFEFITNEKKQDELANLIVAGILVYKEKLPASEEMRAKLKNSYEEFNVKYTAWKNSESYKRLTAESKNFKSQTLLGKIESLNYFNRGGKPTLDGFILNANNKLYRIYADKEQLKSTSFKVGDEVSLFAPKAEVWFDSEYPAIKPKKLVIHPSVGINQINKSFVPVQDHHSIDFQKPILISSSSMRVDTKKGIIYVAEGKYNIGGIILEAKESTFDNTKNTIKATKATITKNGHMIVSDEIVVDVNANYFTVKEIKEPFRLSTFSKIEPEYLNIGFVKSIKYSASDSTRINKKNQIITLYGNAEIANEKMKFKGSEITYNGKLNTATIKNASYYDNEAKVVAEIMEVDFNTSKVISKKGDLKMTWR